MVANRTLTKGIEYVVSRPILATITVGGGILILLAAVSRLAEIYAPIGHLRFLVPFLPPFVITRTAKRINRGLAEFDFIRDAEPVILVGFPRSDRIEALLETRPQVFSDSAVRHLGVSRDELASRPILAAPTFAPGTSEQVFRRLLEQSPDADGRRAVSGLALQTPGTGDAPERRFLLAGVLRPEGSRWKWKLQLSLLPDWEGDSSRRVSSGRSLDPRAETGRPGAGS